MSYSTDSLRAFVKERVGDSDFDRLWPAIDRLICLYQEYKKLSSWLEVNESLLGQREYKEQVTVLNSLMSNILKHEDKLDLFRIRRSGDGDNDVMGSLFGGDSG